jgi:signal peptidase II
MKRMGYSIAAAVFVTDQLVKYWVTHILDLRSVGTIEILPVFNLTWVQNTGVSTGLLRADSDTMRWVLVAATLAIAAAVGVWIVRETNRWDVAALGLVLGGALGNIVDRARFGYVVDFLHVFWQDHHFYVFNVADAAISVGVIVLLVRALWSRDAAKVQE